MRAIAACLLLLLAVVTAPAQAQVSDGAYDQEFPTHLTPSVAEAQFELELRRIWGEAWGSAAVRWLRCPAEEYFVGGWTDEAAEYFGAWQICEARFSVGRTWRATTLPFSDTPGGVQVGQPYTGTWQRRWRDLGRSCHLSDDPNGTVAVNTAACPFLLVDDLTYDLRVKRHLSPRYYSRGTNRAGFQDAYVWRCRRTVRAIRCANRLGDAYKYTPSRAFRRAVNWR